MNLVQILPNAHNWLCVSIKHALEKRGIKTLKPLISQGFQVSVSILVTQDGAVGGIRTLVPLLTTTRFPVVLVMTSSIPLHIRFADKQHGLLYQKYQVCQDGIFGVSCGIDSKYIS